MAVTLPLPLPLLGPVAALVLALALFAPLHLLLLIDPLLVVGWGDWELAGIRFDPSDVVLAGLAAGLALRGRWRRREGDGDLPAIGLWALLGGLISAAFLAAPGNQPYLTDPVRALYQLYRYAWKPLLYYPLALLLLADRRRMAQLALALIAAADAAALIAIPQGYAGLRAGGPFRTGNELGGVMVLPLVLCFAGLVGRPAPRWRWFFVASGLLITRALLFSGSRGAFVAVLAGCALFAAGLLTVGGGRVRVVRLSLLALLAAGGLALLVPDLAERPNVSRLLSVTEGTQADTLRWRMEQRWPHFGALALDHPFLGTGTDVDWSLGSQANTPHSGYLSLALLHGIPAAALFVAFAALAIRAGIRVFRHGASEPDRLLGLAIAAALAGLLVHNLEESTWPHPFVAKAFWMLTAFALALPRLAPDPAPARPDPRR